MPIAPIETSHGPVNKLSDAEIANDAFFGGFRGQAQITAVAVALAESGGYMDAIGDVSLETATWGPSVGLWQIRTLKAQYGTGKQRDFALLLKNDVFQAMSAYAISSGGKSFHPWTTYVNGAYKKFLTRAKYAVTGIVPLTNRTHGENDDGTHPKLPSQTGPIFSPDLPNDAGVPLRISGTRLSGELGTLFTGGTLDLSLDESSLLSVSFIDDAYGLADKYWLENGAVIDYTGIRWLVSQTGVASQGATPISTYQAMPSGVQAMKEQTTGARASIDPTTFMQAVAKGAGLAFFGEPTGSKTSIAPAAVSRPDSNGMTTWPDGTQTQDPLKAVAPGLTVTKLPPTETAWELGQRLAAEAEFLFFEAAGTLYFASQEFIVRRLAGLVVSVDGSHPDNIVSGSQLWVRPMSLPAITVTATEWDTSKTGRRKPHAHDLNYSVDLPREVAGQLRIGMPVTWVGVGPYGIDAGEARAARTYICKITTDLTKPAAPVTIQTRTNVLFKHGVSSGAAVTSAGDETATSLPKTSSTGRRATDMVTVALRQNGDRYVWGAEASAKDPDPDAFDCSELVEWACARVGGYMPDGSANQRAYCVKKGTSVSVAKAIRTRGALLFMGSPVHHVAISLGNGKTIEARGRAYGVGQFSATRGFTSAGLVPSLRY